MLNNKRIDFLLSYGGFIAANVFGLGEGGV
jgi:hypothetical protein